MKPAGAPCERNSDCSFICDGKYKVCAEADTPCQATTVEEASAWPATYQGTVTPINCYVQRKDDTCLCQGALGEVHVDVPLGRFFHRQSDRETLEDRFSQGLSYRCNMPWVITKRDWEDRYEEGLREHVARCPQRLGLD